MEGFNPGLPSVVGYGRRPSIWVLTKLELEGGGEGGGGRGGGSWSDVRGRVIGMNDVMPTLAELKTRMTTDLIARFDWEPM